jgi:hypothetical protein
LGRQQNPAGQSIAISAWRNPEVTMYANASEEGCRRRTGLQTA